MSQPGPNSYAVMPVAMRETIAQLRAAHGTKEMKFAVGVVEGRITFGFTTTIDWFAMTPAEAHSLGLHLLQMTKDASRGIVVPIHRGIIKP